MPRFFNESRQGAHRRDHKHRAVIWSIFQLNRRLKPDIADFGTESAY